VVAGGVGTLTRWVMCAQRRRAHHRTARRLGLRQRGHPAGVGWPQAAVPSAAAAGESLRRPVAQPFARNDCSRAGREGCHVVETPSPLHGWSARRRVVIGRQFIRGGIARERCLDGKQGRLDLKPLHRRCIQSADRQPRRGSRPRSLRSRSRTWDAWAAFSATSAIKSRRSPGRQDRQPGCKPQGAAGSRSTREREGRDATLWRRGRPDWLTVRWKRHTPRKPGGMFSWADSD